MSRFRLFPAMWLLPLLLLATDALPQTTRRPLLIADGAGQPVQLEQLEVTVETAAGFATTTLDMRFRNPNARILEGNLQLPLADGQQVVGFALDVDGTMRDAVPVDKQTGREVFEAIERRGVDPGLLQQTAGNQFELRVYPVPAHGVRQVRVVLMQPLGTRDGQHVLPLPWRVIEQAGTVALHVAGTADRPQLPATVGPVAFRRQGTVWKHVWARGIGGVTGQPELRWAQQETDSTPAVWVQRDRGQAHAVASIPLSGRTAPRALPTTVGLVWDASASGRHRRHDLELAVLDRVLRDAGDVTIQLTVLRDVPEVARTFHIRGGDWTALRQQLQALVYDGASNPGGWAPDPAIAYYLHVGDGLFNAGDRRDLALRVLSNLAELQIENRHLLRVLAYRLLQAEAPALALPYLQRVLDLADDEPQSHRDLGLTLAMNDQPQAAAEQLYEVVVREWDDRFGGVDMIALAELNALLAKERSRIDTTAFDKRLLRNLPVGLRAVLSWDADNSDMDLWVTDPNGEKTYYSNPRSHQGGRLSEDFTGGYGPEEFVLRDPKPGRYVVEANYFGDRQQVVTGDTTLQLWLSTGFGTPRQVDRRITLRLRGAKETVLVGEFTVP